jgi:hypothetical protein
MGFVVSGVDGVAGFFMVSGSATGFSIALSIGLSMLPLIALAASCSSHFKISMCPRVNLPTSSLAVRQAVLSFSTPSEVSLNTDRYSTAGTLAAGLAAAIGVCAMLVCHSRAQANTKLVCVAARNLEIRWVGICVVPKRIGSRQRARYPE